MSETVAEKPLEEKGTISVQMENIFPIIKKWLYSDKEIFVRELVSNSMDAINKFKHLSLIGEAEKPAEEEEYKVEIRLDKEAKTLSVIDNGLGMTADEIKKYINQVAFSGAEEFLNKYKSEDESSQIIGHFGLGFYSSFMVSKRVEIQSLSHKKDAEPVMWTCEGNPSFEISTGRRKERGTEVILHLLDEEKEFLDDARVKHLVTKYCDFLPYKITINGEDANKRKALWNEQPQSLKSEDYLEFYKEQYPFTPDPLFWIHLNVDYPFNLKGILYFPHLEHELDSSQNNVKLFCNNVFVSDNTQEILPRFLTILRGGIDSPNIPLNVSRSMLQNDGYVRKISSHIVKKVSDRLKKMYKKEKDDYVKAWEGIHIFVKAGVMEDEKFHEQMSDFILFKTTEGKHITLADYKDNNEAKTENKVYYTSDPSQTHYIDMYKEQGIEVLILDSFIDSHFINYMEMKDGKMKFTRIDSDITENLVSKDKKAEVIVDPKTNKTSNDVLEDVFKSGLELPELKIKVETLTSNSVPAVISFSEQMRRMQEMTSMMGQKMPEMPADYTLVINSNNPIVENLKTISESGSREDDVKLIINHIHDTALLAQKMIKPEQMSGYVERSNKILELFSK